MKKMIYLIVGILLFVPLFVKADMGSPMIIEYKASVTNPDGAQFYKYDWENNKYILSGKSLSYGTEVTVMYEEKGRASLKNYDDYVKIEDITSIEKEYSVTLKDLQASKDAIVLKDREIKTGPAEGYSGTGVIIAAGTNIKIRFFKLDGYENPWVYVEYNNTKGFIDILEASVAYDTSEAVEIDRMINKNAKIVDPATSKVVGTIKTNTIISDKLLVVDPWSHSYYLTYNGVSGIVSYYDFVDKEEKTEKYKLTQKYDLHETSEEESKVIKTLDSDTVFDTDYIYWDKGYYAIYYESGNVKGWIIPRCKEGAEDEFIGIEKVTGSNAEQSQDVEYSSEEPKQDTEEKNEEVNSEVKATKPNETLYICIGGAVILCLTAVVIVILINRKKKAKK